MIADNSMSVLLHTTQTEQETVDLGSKWAARLKPGDTVFFFGGLGCGKTAMIRGIGKHFGIPENTINSPTFILLNQYQGQDNGQPVWLYHFDLYRLRSLQDITDTGLYEFMNEPQFICLIEWAERIPPPLPKPHWKVEFTILDNLSRSIRMEHRNNAT